MINEPLALTVNSLSTGVACSGDSTGTATVQAMGGTLPYSYLWSDGQTTAMATGLAAGTYSVTVLDANECSIELMNIIVSQTNGIEFDSILVNDISCTGSTDGSATVVNVSGGTPPYSYLWSDGQTTATAANLAAGTYTVTVSDAVGCSVSDSITIIEPANGLVIDSTTVTDIPCNGGVGSATVFASGGVMPYSYLWSTGSTSQSILNVTSGVYVVTVTDNNGCVVSTSITINQPAPLWCSASGTDALCFGDSSGTATVDTIMGGTPPYSYLWSDGQMTRTATGLLAGVYTVTITDANGCSKVETAMLMQPSEIICYTTQTDNTCSDDSSATATVYTLGGTPPYSFIWSDGQTAQIATGLANGNYTVIVSDASGCSKVHGPISIISPNAIQLGLNTTPISCYNGSDGSISVSVSGGTSPYFYMWNNGNVASVLTGVSAGIYTVTVTDFRGCTSSGQISLTAPDSITCIVTSNDPSCNGGNDGTATVVATGGTAPYTYSWANGQTTMTATGLSAGPNFVTIVDANGCIKVKCVKLIEPTSLLCGINGTNLLCNGDSSGSASAVAQGGTPPYSYLWNTGDTLSTITGLAAGNYSVVVSDYNGCTTSCNINIIEPPAISISISVVDATCGSSNGSVNATVNGGTMPYSFLWNTGNVTTAMTNLTAGTYTLIVTDANGCINSASVTVGQGSTVACNITNTTTPSCSGYNNGSATVAGSGGAPPYTYLWLTSPIQVGATATGLPAGTYTVIVTDDVGCTAVCQATINDPLPLACTIMQSNNQCNGDSTASITIMMAGGVPPYSYLWSNGQTTQTATGLTAGTYVVVVTDANGCVLNKVVTIDQVFDLSCYTSSVKEICGHVKWNCICCCSKWITAIYILMEYKSSSDNPNCYRS